MIYAKVFLDEDKETGDQFIVVEAPTKNVDEQYCLLAGDHIDCFGTKYNIAKTRILSAKSVAISIEAKEKLLELYSFGNKNKIYAILFDDFSFLYYRDIYGQPASEFSFKPDKMEIPNKKVFNVKNEIWVDYDKYDTQIMDFMQVYSNDFLKNLDITEPVSEKQIELLLKGTAEK